MSSSRRDDSSQSQTSRTTPLSFTRVRFDVDSDLEQPSWTSASDRFSRTAAGEAASTSRRSSADSRLNALASGLNSNADPTPQSSANNDRTERRDQDRELYSEFLTSLFNPQLLYGQDSRSSLSANPRPTNRGDGADTNDSSFRYFLRRGNQTGTAASSTSTTGSRYNLRRFGSESASADQSDSVNEASSTRTSRLPTYSEFTDQSRHSNSWADFTSSASSRMRRSRFDRFLYFHILFSQAVHFI